MFLSAIFLVQVLVAEESPLDRLRSRSAEKRWKSIRERVTDRREVRRERIEKRKIDSAENKPEEENSPRPPAEEKVFPVTEHQSVYQERFQLNRNKRREGSSPKHSAKKGSSKQKRGDVGSILMPMPTIHPARLSHSTQTRKSSGIQAIPVSETKAIKTAFAPELPMPAPSGKDVQLKEIEAGLLGTKTPEEVENSIKAQGVYGQFDKIKPVQSISPFVDYEPDQKLRKEDPGRHLCLPDANRPGLTSNANVQCPDIENLPGADLEPSRNFAHLNYAWKASNVHSHPLYFEDPNLERYGHIHGPLIQPAVSVARFNLQLLGLPYQMAMQPISKCVYPLGHSRPGDACTPKYYYQVPLNPWAALVTAEVYTGLFFIIP